ncbi:F-box/kelch-repeat protein At1g67480-like [Mercurialis annua]|uniref:F-box/kelch-repeat protein At1g67480-like n=1 Tax=Mercurialis annua TaxID=3986 RepID=UPI00215E1F0C|nr:F-box/kelch-repeat protein At1g67480-like [Mercurialis annua]
MGALPSPRETPSPPPLPEFSLSNFRVCASFCHKNMSNWIECYDPSNNSWSHLSQIPGLAENHVLKDFVMVSLGNSIYIIGGRLCYKKISQSHESSEIEVRSNVIRYNALLNEWFDCASISVPRYDFACTVCENKIYVAGGKSNLDSARGTSSAEVYDPISDVWTDLPSMSTLRYKCVGVTFQGKIHVVGGFTSRADSDKTEPFIMERSSAEVYDTRTGRWQIVVGMWQLDVPPNQILAVGGRLFSSGDCLKAWKGHIEAYDGKLNMWDVVDGSHLQTLNFPISTSDANSRNWPPTQQLYLTMAPIGSHLYFLSGYRMTEEMPRMISTVHSFDTSAKSDAWRSFEPVEEDDEKVLCSHCCVVQIA